MCQQEVIDDLDKYSVNGVAETNAWLQWAKREWGEDVGMKEMGQELKRI